MDFPELSALRVRYHTLVMDWAAERGLDDEAAVEKLREVWPYDELLLLEAKDLPPAARKGHQAEAAALERQLGANVEEAYDLLNEVADELEAADEAEDEADAAQLLRETLTDILDVALESSGLPSDPAKMERFERDTQTLGLLASLEGLLQRLDEQGVPLELWNDASFYIETPQGEALRLLSDGGDRLALLDVLEGSVMPPPDPSELISEPSLAGLLVYDAFQQLFEVFERLVQHAAQFQ